MRSLRAALEPASLFALCSFLIAAVALVAYRLCWFEIIQPQADGPALHPLTALGVMLLSACIVLDKRHIHRLVDGTCVLVLLVALERLIFPGEAGRRLVELNPFPGGPEAVVSTSTALCLLLLAVSLLLRRYRDAALSQVFAVLAYSVPALALVGSVLGVREVHASMSLTTMLMLLPLCVATALHTVYHGFLRVLLAPTRISGIARRYLAFMMMVPYLLGLWIVGIDPDAADISFAILIVASSQGAGLVAAFLTLSFGNLERRSAILQRRAATRARRDGLTGALNRAGFTRLARREIERRHNGRNAASLLFVDVDHFKHINDTYGHTSGDRVLKRIIRHARGCLRRGDSVARWGGEEFLILLPDTNLQGALRIAEKLRLCIGSEHFDDLATGLRVTVSIGCAQSGNGEGLDELVSRADRALYAAKQGGRNRTVAA